MSTARRTAGSWIDVYCAEHRRILATAGRFNALHGLTGFLHREGETFVQVLEGPRASVEDPLARIKRDARHRDVQVRMAEDVETRLFADWSMGYSDDKLLSLSRGRGIPGRARDIAVAPIRDAMVFLSSSAATIRGCTLQRVCDRTLARRAIILRC